MLNVSTPSTTATGYSSTAEPNFLHPKRVLRSWYPIAQSRDVKRGKVLSVERLNRRLSIWRDQHGAVHVLDARCPHLGADLGQGRVVDDTLECPFHQWRWASDGHCSAARGWSEPPTRRTRSYPVQEQWGLIWIFNGPAVQFDLPTPPPTHGKILRLPQQIIACHPHLVIANGIDIIHMQALHGMHFSEPAHWQIDKQGIRVVYTGTPGSAWQRWLTRTTHTVMRATNTVIGPNLAWLDVHEPYQFQALFATQPAPDTTCRTQVIVFLPSQKRLIIAAISLLGVILLADRALLNNLDFHPGWTEHDATFQAFADSLNKMEAW